MGEGKQGRRKRLKKLKGEQMVTKSLPSSVV